MRNISFPKWVIPIVAINLSLSVFADISVNDGETITISSNETHGEININNGGKLIIDTGVTLTTDALRVYGPTGTLELSGTAIMNIGTNQMENSGIIDIGDDAQLNATGTFNNNDGGQITADGNFTVTGNLRNNNNGSIDGSGMITSNNDVENNGSIFGFTTNPIDCSAGCSSSSLPVEFLGMTHLLNKGTLTLNWSTAQEIDNEYFEIRGSSDGQLFFCLHTVEGSGTTLETTRYQSEIVWQDHYCYLQLWQFDYDGTGTLLASQRVQDNSLNSISITPTLVKSSQPISIKYDGPFQWSVRSLNGLIISSGIASDIATINLANQVKKGVFIVQVNEITKRILVY